MSIWFLGFATLTGIITLVFRETQAMRIIFSIHMGFVLSLFLVMPYGKFVHFSYRFVALVKNGIEEELAAPDGAQ